MSEKLIVNVKQGEQISIEMRITSDGTPVDLSNSTIEVQVKEAPYVELEPMFTKTITVNSDAATQGQITDPLNGVFNIRFNEEDTSYPVNTYALIVFFDDGINRDIISSKACNNGEYRVCTQ